MPALQRLIQPIHDDWRPATAAGPAIAAWEERNAARLPDDYRAFMLCYDGGRPVPKTFRHSWADEDGTTLSEETYLEPFYDWARVVEWSGELGNRIPAGTLAIGANPGLIEVLLSLRAADHGAVYSWLRNWGAFEPGNDHLCRQADSFRAFVEGLYDDGAGVDGWRLPGLIHLERRLEF